MKNVLLFAIIFIKIDGTSSIKKRRFRHLKKKVLKLFNSGFCLISIINDFKTLLLLLITCIS